MADQEDETPTDNVDQEPTAEAAHEAGEVPAAAVAGSGTEVAAENSEAAAAANEPPPQQTASAADGGTDVDVSSRAELNNTAAAPTTASDHSHSSVEKTPQQPQETTTSAAALAAAAPAAAAAAVDGGDGSPATLQTEHKRLTFIWQDDVEEEEMLDDDDSELESRYAEEEQPTAGLETAETLAAEPSEVAIVDRDEVDEMFGKKYREMADAGEDEEQEELEESGEEGDEYETDERTPSPIRAEHFAEESEGEGDQEYDEEEQEEEQEPVEKEDQLDDQEKKSDGSSAVMLFSPPRTFSSKSFAKVSSVPSMLRPTHEEDRAEEEEKDEEEEELDEAAAEREELLALEREQAAIIRRKLMKQQYQQAMADRRKLLMLNKKFQHDLWFYFHRAAAARPVGATDSPDGPEHQQKYFELIDELYQKQLDDHSNQQQWAQTADQMVLRCQKQQELADGAWQRLMGIKRSAMIGRPRDPTTAAIRNKNANEYAEAETKRWQNACDVNITFIKTSSDIKKLEKILKDKETISDGLMTSDFDQLKMDNQGLNEKIEDRTETIAALSRKLMTNVQVITHIKEKIHHMSIKNHMERKLLERAEEEVARRRTLATCTKKERDALRRDTRELRERSALLSHPNMLRDMERKINENEHLTRLHAHLESHYANASISIRKLQRKIKKATANKKAGRD